MSDSEKTFSEFFLRYLQAKRDFPHLDVGPEPEQPKISLGFAMPIFMLNNLERDRKEAFKQLRNRLTREFQRST